MTGSSSRTPWIVCFGGEDWWYHSHGHFDIQLMKQYAKRTRVLYVNSIGMRMPSVRRDPLFLSRVLRKIRSISKRLRRTTGGVFVYSPVPVPFYGSHWGQLLNKLVLLAQLNWVFHRLSVECAIIWVTPPTAWPVARALGTWPVVYQRTDDHAAYDFPNFNRRYVAEMDVRLLRAARLVIHVSAELHAQAIRLTEHSFLYPQGVDDMFFRAVATIPAKMNEMQRPIAGYVGGMDSHKFDAALMEKVVRAMSDVTFVFVGPENSNAENLRECQNVHFLGTVPHTEVPDYVHAFDVCLLPTALTEWGLSCRPLKLLEYLAAGSKVVASPTPAARQYSEHISIASSAPEWVSAIRDAIVPSGTETSTDKNPATASSWSILADRIWEQLCADVFPIAVALAGSSQTRVSEGVDDSGANATGGEQT